MATTNTIPVNISTEATERVAELGMQREFREIIDHTLESVPDLRILEVTLEYDPHGVDDPQVVIWAHRRENELADDPTIRNWDDWIIGRFSADVGRRFCFMSTCV
jgi:hypothetical protein